jgi:hypothetical protein
MFSYMTAVLNIYQSDFHNNKGSQWTISYPSFKEAVVYLDEYMSKMDSA